MIWTKDSYTLEGKIVKNNQLEQGNKYIGSLSVHIGVIDGSSIADTGWVYRSITFHFSGSGSVKVMIYMPFEHVWIDDLKLTPL